MSKYSAVITKIHNEFNTAGEKLLRQANEIISGKEHLALKANRLLAIGFQNANEVEQWNKIKISKEQADFVIYYRVHYPNNKFIIEQQVELINNKYKLVCAPIQRYKGFVPDRKLKAIEDFKLNAGDKCEIMAKINSYTYPLGDKKGIANIRAVYPNDIVPMKIIRNSSVIYGFGGGMGIVNVSAYSLIDKESLFICAPKKDINMEGLSKIGALFAPLTTVTVPDPVVLQPVKGGYLIVTAWGDEASDELVVNEIMN